VPPLHELVSVLTDALHRNFEQVAVSVVQCPDLSTAPWSLAGRGLCGSPKLLDIGGELNLFYPNNRAAQFDFVECAKKVELPDAFMVGPGAGARSIVGTNCELIANVNVGTNKFDSRIGLLAENDRHVQEVYSHKEIGILCNLLACEGAPGEVLSVRVAKRKGDTNFVSCMRKGLQEYYTPYGLNIGMGGVFLIKKGSIHAHIMPDFPPYELSAEKCKVWLKFFEFHAPLTCASVFLAEDIEGMNLRVEHTHFFSEHGEGGHYHYDTTPQDIEYEGFFVPCGEVWRLGQPSPNPSPC